MRFLILALLLSFLPLTTQAQPFHAGITRIAVQADPVFETYIWYPTQAEETHWNVRPFSLPATHDAEIATGPFPIILLSHGGGQTCASPLILGDLSADLARQGYAVIAPIHCKTGLAQRIPQVTAALRAVTADPRFQPHLAPDRLGMLGFSLGGAVTLELAGGVPDLEHLATYCSAHLTDTMSCNPGPGGSTPARPATSIPHLPLKALALLDPFGVPFVREGLTAVTMPVLIVRPEQSQLGEANTQALATGLPQPPRVQTIPGTHFIFAGPCSSALQTEVPVICEDPPGTDRAAVHATVKARLEEFFRKNL
jgi:predicted dienelactone hydrolase